MIYFQSTNDRSVKESLEEAVLRGLAEDGGLFIPERIPTLSQQFFDIIDTLTFPEIAFEVSKNLFQGAIQLTDLKRIVNQSMEFDPPLEEVSPGVYALELFQGSSLSFKDYGASFMAQLMGYFVNNNHQTMELLVASSGETGSAIAQAFLNITGIRVWILYPKGAISLVQEKQMTTLGENIKVIEIEGTFEECKNLVKQALEDNDLRQNRIITTANSINVARLIAQTFYYFYAYARLKSRNTPLVFSVPCGNFGNLTAGILARQMGLPIAHFVAATNVNDSVPRFLETGKFDPKPSIKTFSGAMDVGNPTNFARILDLFDQDRNRMKEVIFGASFNDEQTIGAVKDVFDKTGYISDPHGAVAYLGLQAFLAKNPGSWNGVFLETAHPSKYSEKIEKIIEFPVPVPKFLQDMLKKEGHSVVLPPDYTAFREMLLT